MFKPSSKASTGKRNRRRKRPGGGVKETPDSSKKKPIDVNMEMDDEDDGPEKKLGKKEVREDRVEGRGLYKSKWRKMKKKGGIKGIQWGDKFKSNKGKGDSKKKSTLEPYAYIPLDKGMLNRRRKNKYKNVFAQLMTKTRT